MAVKALWSEYGRLAVDASYHDFWKSDNAAAVNASKRRERIKMAIEVLDGIKTEKIT